MTGAVSFPGGLFMEDEMIKVGIIGATGYAGGELVRILTNHKDAQILWYGSRSYIDKHYYEDRKSVV